MDNYTDNDARLLIIEFVDKHPYPDFDFDEVTRKIIEWERELVVYALEQGHENGYKQREEGL